MYWFFEEIFSGPFGFPLLTRLNRKRELSGRGPESFFQLSFAFHLFSAACSFRQLETSKTPRLVEGATTTKKPSSPLGLLGSLTDQDSLSTSQGRLSDFLSAFLSALVGDRRNAPETSWGWAALRSSLSPVLVPVLVPVPEPLLLPELPSTVWERWLVPVWSCPLCDSPLVPPPELRGIHQGLCGWSLPRFPESPEGEPWNHRLGYLAQSGVFGWGPPKT
jgi:hypothetical protein